MLPNDRLRVRTGKAQTEQKNFRFAPREQTFAAVFTPCYRVRHAPRLPMPLSPLSPRRPFTLLPSAESKSHERSQSLGLIRLVRSKPYAVATPSVTRPAVERTIRQHLLRLKPLQPALTSAAVPWFDSDPRTLAAARPARVLACYGVKLPPQPAQRRYTYQAFVRRQVTYTAANRVHGVQ
jgi:hypothetical protein